MAEGLASGPRLPGQSTEQATAGWVIDASVTMPWFFPDEATRFTERLLDAQGERVLWAPAL